MEYLLLFVIVVLVAAQSVISKQYNLTVKKVNAFFFSGIASFAALLVFLIRSGGNLNFTWEIVIYSVLFGLSYASALGGEFLSVRWGSLSITALVLSYSLTIPTLYGIWALGEKLSPMGIAGIIFLVFSIFLINDIKGKTKFSLKWVICLIVTFVGNGMCSTVMKVQQIDCNGAYKNEFMIIALFIAGVVFMIISRLTKENVKEGFWPCAGFGILKGTANGIVNSLTIILTGLIPNVILFPSVSAGGIVLGFLMAVCVYKEKLTRRQLVGYVIGTISVVLLNL